MTKEELKKEAETEYRKQEEHCKHSWNGAVFQFGYLAGAEPREKRIAELEKENVELKKWQKDTIKARGNDYMDWSRMKDQLTKATKLLKWALHSDPEHDSLVDFDAKWKETEQFLKEIEK